MTRLFMKAASRGCWLVNYEGWEEMALGCGIGQGYSVLSAHHKVQMS